MADVFQVSPDGLIQALGMSLAGASASVVEALAAIERRSNGAFMARDFCDEAFACRSQLWSVRMTGREPSLRGIAGTCIRTTGHGVREAHIQFATGEGSREWRDSLLDEIEEWAAAEGCVRILPFSRPGWQKWFQSRGYRVRHVEMERALR